LHGGGCMDVFFKHNSRGLASAFVLLRTLFCAKIFYSIDFLSTSTADR